MEVPFRSEPLPPGVQYCKSPVTAVALSDGRWRLSRSGYQRREKRLAPGLSTGWMVSADPPQGSTACAQGSGPALRIRPSNRFLRLLPKDSHGQLRIPPPRGYPQSDKRIRPVFLSTGGTCVAGQPGRFPLASLVASCTISRVERDGLGGREMISVNRPDTFGCSPPDVGQDQVRGAEMRVEKNVNSGFR